MRSGRKILTTCECAVRIFLGYIARPCGDRCGWFWCAIAMRLQRTPPYSVDGAAMLSTSVPHRPMAVAGNAHLSILDSFEATTARILTDTPDCIMLHVRSPHVQYKDRMWNAVSPSHPHSDHSTKVPEQEVCPQQSYEHLDLWVKILHRRDRIFDVHLRG